MATTPLDPAAHVLECLGAAPGRVVFVSQLRAVSGLQDGQLDSCLASLEGSGTVVSVAHAAPDRHLTGDWRVAALVDPARGAVEAATRARHHYDTWVRDLLMTHRCT